jgi:hypothetical protein
MIPDNNNIKSDQLAGLAKDNFHFYSGSLGKEILNIQNFTPKIIAHLQAEQEILLTCLNLDKHKYQAMLEIGCGDARNIHLSFMLKLHYFGIDFSPFAIQNGWLKINKNNLAGQLKCLSLLDLNLGTTPVPHAMSTIAIFPFNVFGNIFQPHVIFKSMSLLNYNMLISTYRNEMSQHIAAYYHACGLSEIEVLDVENGTLFLSSQGFKATIYHENYIHQLAEQSGYFIQSHEFSELGKLYYLEKKLEN